MNAFNAADFRAKIGNTRPATPNLFYVEMTDPGVFKKALYSNLIKDQEQPVNWAQSFQELSFRCEIADLPGRVVSTSRREYHGPHRDVPNGIVYNTMNISIIEHKDYKIRQLFDMWQETAFSQKAGSIFRLPYYEDLVTDIKIVVLAPDGSFKRLYVLYDAYPIAIAPSQLGWSMNDTYMQIPIEFSYHRWESFATSQIQQFKSLKPNAQDLVKISSDSLKLVPSANTFISSAQGIADRASAIASESNIGSQITAAAQDIVNNARSLEDLAKNKAGGLISQFSATAQSIIDKGASLAEENIPYPINSILTPVAQSAVQQKLDKTKETALKKLSSFF